MRLSSVEVAGSPIETGQVDVVDDYRQDVFNGTKQRPLLRLAQFVLRPDLISVSIRNEDKAESGLVAIYRRKVLEEVFAPELMREELIVKDPNIAIDQMPGD